MKRVIIFLSILAVFSLFASPAFAPPLAERHLALTGPGGNGTVTMVQPFDIIQFNVSLHNMDIDTYGSTYWVYFDRGFGLVALPRLTDWRDVWWGNRQGDRPPGQEPVPEPMSVNQNGHGSARFWIDVGATGAQRVEIFSDSDLATPVLTSEWF